MKLRSFRLAALLLAGLLLFSSVASAAAAPSLLDKLLEKKQEALQVDIGGIYYGSFSFTDCSEAYRPYEGRVYDAYMLVAADETGDGRLRVYLNQADPMFLQGSCRADGKSILVDQPLYFGETAGESLSFEPGKLADLYVANGSYALDGEGFSYRLCLRPYGALWEDAAAEWEYSLLLPPGYADYLDYVAEGLIPHYVTALGNLESEQAFGLVGQRHPLNYVLDVAEVYNVLGLYDLGDFSDCSIEFREDGRGVLYYGIEEIVFTYDEERVYFSGESAFNYTIQPDGQLYLNAPGQQLFMGFGQYSPLGVYYPVDAYMDGEYQSAPENDGSYRLELYPGGRAVVWSEGEYSVCTYTEDRLVGEDMELNLQLYNGWLTLDDGETLIRFLRDEGSQFAWMAYDLTEALNNVFVSEYCDLEVNTDFYGSMLYLEHEDLGGGNSYGNCFDVTASFASTGDGDLFFEVYNYEEPDKVIFSMWVEQEGNVLYPVIGEEDAWIYDMYFSPETGEGLVLELQNGAIEFFCTYYKKDVERLEIRFFLRPVGSAWDTANDPLPPAYWDTVEEETH